MDNDSFLDDIIANPEDDTIRLVYADWLEERGFAERAELIRVQCELALKPKYDPSRLLLRKREQELLAEHGSEWAKPVAAITRDYEFNRGFIETVAIGGRKLVTHGEKLFRAAPIRDVRLLRLSSSNTSIADIANCKLFPRIRGLAIHGHLDRAELRTIVTAPGLKSLTALTLESYFYAEAIEPVLAGCMPKLESLNVGVLDGGTLNTAHVAALAKARWASSLRRLNLKHHAVNVGGVRAIATSKHLKGLTHLGLQHCGVGLGGTQALAQSSSFANLFSLDLRSNRLTDNAMRALAATSKLPALTELFLGMNEIGPGGAQALANWPGLAKLRFLHLYSNPIGDDGVRALAESPHVANLWYLDLTDTDMGDRGTRALAESPYLKSVRIGSFKGDEKEEA